MGQAKGKILVRYKGQDIVNHQYDIILPRFDIRVYLLLWIYRHETNQQEKELIYEDIAQLLQETGGQFLNWI